MGNRQFFAQIGVFALLGLNVAAYYVFWPRGDRPSAVHAKGQDNLVESLKVAKKSPAAKAPEASEHLPSPRESASVPVPPIAPIAGKEADQDTVRRLLGRIEADGPVAAPPFNVEILAPVPAPLNPESPRPLPPLLADPLSPPAPGEIAKAAQAALTAPAAQMQQSPWQITTEIVSDRTQLIVQLKPRMPARSRAEFKILCDRVEMKSPDGALQAVGKVTFAGSGLTGSCQRLTLSLDEVRIVFEGDVRIGYDSAPGMLRSDRFEWDLANEPAEARPAVFRTPTPLPR